MSPDERVVSIPLRVIDHRIIRRLRSDSARVRVDWLPERVVTHHTLGAHTIPVGLENDRALQ
ncbi:hypothetical protein, partial [Microcella sp.]